jgi:hypothetical protein
MLRVALPLNLGATLRRALAEITLIELLEAAERTFYVELADVLVWLVAEAAASAALMDNVPKDLRRALYLTAERADS